LFITAVGVQLVLLVVGLLIPPLKFIPRMGLKLTILLLLPAAFLLLGIITPLETRQAWLYGRNRLQRMLHC